MKLLFRLAGALFAAFLLFLIWRQVFPDDTAQIRKTLTTLATALSRSEAPSPAAAFLLADKIRDCFDPAVSVEVQAGPYGRLAFADREELVQSVVGLLTRSGETRIQLSGTAITLGPDPDRASVKLTARALQRDGEPFVRDFKFGFVKKDGNWRIQSVVPDEVKP